MILGLEPVSFQEYLDNPSSAVLSDDQLKRSSYLANIHHALREVFSNPENVYGFMKMENHNPIFDGRTPLSILKDSDLNSFAEAFQSICKLKSVHE